MKEHLYDIVSSSGNALIAWNIILCIVLDEVCLGSQAGLVSVCFLTLLPSAGITGLGQLNTESHLRGENLLRKCPHKIVL